MGGSVTEGAADDSYAFNDFGKDFACVDPTGENPQSGMIVHVEQVRLHWKSQS